MRQMAIPLLAVLALSPSPTLAKKEFFPPEVKGVTWIDLNKFDEPSFIAPNALRDYRVRYRLSITGIVCTEYVIRIDEKENGVGRGTMSKRSRCPGRGPEYTVQSFRVSEQKMQEFRADIVKAKLWELFPEFWGSQDDICVDGEELYFERLNVYGYRISLANAQCTAPRELLEVAKQFLLLAHQPDAIRLLQ